MQISWYKSDRSCGKKGTDSGKGSKLLAYAPRTCGFNVLDPLVFGNRPRERPRDSCLATGHEKGHEISFKTFARVIGAIVGFPAQDPR